MECEALTRLNKMKKDSKSRYSIIIEYRNFGTHRDRIPRFFNIVMNESRKVSFKNPHATEGEPMDEDIPQFLQSSIENMRELIQVLRALL